MVGEPRMGGRGFRCRKSGSFGEPRRGRQDWSPWDGCGGLACGWPNTAPSGSVGGLGSLEWTRCRSDRLGALCRRLPSPVVRGECSGTEEPGRDGQAWSLQPGPHCPQEHGRAPRLFITPFTLAASQAGDRHPPGSHTRRRRGGNPLPPLLLLVGTRPQEREREGDPAQSQRSSSLPGSRLRPRR